MVVIVFIGSYSSVSNSVSDSGDGSVTAARKPVELEVRFQFPAIALSYIRNINAKTWRYGNGTCKRNI